MAETSRMSRALTLLRNLFLAALVYAVIFGIIQATRTPLGTKGKLGIPSVLDKTGPADVIKTTKAGVKVKFAGTSKAIIINPHANVFNRPESAVKVKDDYMGRRPHVDTEADLQLLIEECRGTYTGLEKIRNIFDCLQFLAKDQERYYKLPETPHRASQQDPRRAEYLNADGNGNTEPSYVSVEKALQPTKESPGLCPGAIIPYHVYWSGPATWRVEAFIKSYLYTQNLACSRLWIWLDTDRNTNAVQRMLQKDALFARFLPLVDAGYIFLKPWKFPKRIPLPKHLDNTDGAGYYKNPGKPNSKGETIVADGIVEDRNGQQWLALSPKQMSFLPVAVADAVRFVVLHVHGGVYCDMDVLMLRDMRPLLLPKNHSFAQRWAAYAHPGDYNTAIISLSANSSLSSYLLRGGVRMGLNFHPRVIGRMAWKDGRDKELLMLETAAFDPVWTEFNWDREGRCTVPCLRDYSAAFKGKKGAIKDEWESYDGPRLETVPLNENFPSNELKFRELTHAIAKAARAENRNEKRNEHIPSSSAAQQPGNGSHDGPESFSATIDEEAELRQAGVVAGYRFDEDKYPPNNRTLENFFRGAWTYHIHSQWLKHPEPSSWIAVLQQAHDNFLSGGRMNLYGETWNGPTITPYNYWPEYV
ncbi:hypothetical protein M501DRAFT_986354 [Patellaria atrata CBS 101060]|uniref:SnoRNA binding protein n=1 Tax=Patellaria atrata CBS 101060 TaxID=1346257 RepID=A0A9P4S990_9PEZI|nr:hypothetical protein M501DRAFT_986354 [Patellaria atrata CBS 101060]